MAQLALKIKSVVEKEVDGLEMGVLEDDTSYLTGRGLARLCGVAFSAIINQSAKWKAGDRSGRLATMLEEAGIDRDSLYTTIERDGVGVASTANAYTDDVCTVMLAYYAYGATRTSATARQNFHKLARTSLRTIIHGALGYTPRKQVTAEWQKFHERLLLNKVPAGHFSVFTEGSSLVLAAIREGLPVDEHTIPDISIGRTWSDFWVAHLAAKHLPRTKFEHNYPSDFAQSKVDVEAWIYPNSALGDFRDWMEKIYIPLKFPEYLKRKARKGAIDVKAIGLILGAVEPAALPPAKTVKALPTAAKASKKKS